jgi:hypothetical protein
LPPHPPPPGHAGQYKLRVWAPDRPTLAPALIALNLRTCAAGEYNTSYTQGASNSSACVMSTTAMCQICR